VRLLLIHCAALTRAADSPPAARGRLEDALGDQLTRLLVAGLGNRRRDGRLAA